MLFCHRTYFKEIAQPVKQMESKISSCSDIVVYSSSNPFSNSLQSNERVFLFFNIVLKLYQKWTEGGKGGTNIGFGASVYESSIILAKYLEINQAEIEGKSVLEIGCGPGLSSIVASLAGAANVFMSDGDPISVSLADENFRTNVPDKPIFPCKLFWGDPVDTVQTQMLIKSKIHVDQVDVIIASDVAALPYAESFHKLVETMCTFCKPSGFVLLVYQQRHSEENTFFSLFSSKFHVTQVQRTESDFSISPIIVFRGTPRGTVD